MPRPVDPSDRLFFELWRNSLAADADGLERWCDGSGHRLANGLKELSRLERHLSECFAALASGEDLPESIAPSTLDDQLDPDETIRLKLANLSQFFTGAFVHMADREALEQADRRVRQLEPAVDTWLRRLRR